MIITTNGIHIFSLVSFKVVFNRNHGCNNRMPPMEYVIFGPIDQYTEKSNK